MTLATDCLMLGVHEGGRFIWPAAELEDISDGYLSRAMRRAGFSGERGQSLLLLNVPKAKAERVILIGCGVSGRVDARRYRRIARATAKALAGSGARDAVSTLSTVDVKRRDTCWNIRQLIEINEHCHYRFDCLKSRKESPNPTPQPARIRLALGPRSDTAAAKRACAEAMAVAHGVAFARDLGNLPGNVCTPSYLAKEARALNVHPSLKITVLGEAKLKQLGMGALLSTARGSRQPAKLIVVEHRQGPKEQRPVVLVGKGVTFDTGGISLKPTRSMDESKFEMCGAASVLGTLKACALLALPINAIGVVAAVENMPGGSAVKPGDVVTSMSGKTIEILNTNADGRLALCDALTYAKRFKPAVIVDVATLTGACVAALGKYPHGLFSNSGSLRSALERAGRTAHDRPWPMPLWDEYFAHLDSAVADLASVGGRNAGAVTAACFLARFAGSTRWAHLDIAGTAWQGGKDKGATGRPVPLLTQFLLDRAAGK